MSRWFRLYDEILDDPKVQKLSGDDFKAWVNLLCLASRNGGRLPAIHDIAFALRLDEIGAGSLVDRLLIGGLIEKRKGGVNGSFIAPHAWEERQYKSDTSTERVKRFRQRSKTVTETPPDTETDTELPLEINSNGAGNVSSDPEKVLFDTGIAMLKAQGKSEQQARTLIGKWKRDHGTGQVIEMFGAAQRMAIVDIASWAEGRWRAGGAEARMERPIC